MRTKAGNSFYILIDRDDEGETTAETPTVCTYTEKCEAGSVNVGCPVYSADRTQCAGAEAEPELEEAAEEQEDNEA